MVSVNSNMGGMRAHDALQTSHRLMQTSLERLSTGVRINRAEDDAAGVMVRDRFNAQVFGFEEGIRNIQTAQGMIQVAEQGLNKITDALQQMRALAVRAADDNLNDDDRGRIQNQIKGLLREVNERAQRTVYNGHNLLDGSIADSRASRDGGAQIQTNSFLANGTKLVSGVSTLGNNATTINGISQGSYQVKLVYDADKRDTPVMTKSTTLRGSNTSGHAYLNSTAGPTTITQQIYDRNGEAHDVNITFTNAGANTWNYEMTSGAGGAWSNPINVTGTVTFNNNGDFQNVAVTGGSTTSAAVGSKVNVQIADGTGDGQKWAVDFGMLKENDQSPAVSTPNATTNGTEGGMETTAAQVLGRLSAAAPAGTITSFSSGNGWTDRAGVEHAITYTFQKTLDQTGGSANADTWSLTLSGFLPSGAWSGAASNTTVSVEFDSAGNLQKINGQNATSFNVNVSDGTSSGQDVAVDLSQLLSGAPVAPSASANGVPISPSLGLSDVYDGNATPPPRTSLSTFSGHLNSDALVGAVQSVALNWYDRTGAAHLVNFDLTKTVDGPGDADTWDYSAVGPFAGGVWTGASGATSGTLTFDANGNPSGATSFLMNVADGTTGGQDVTLDFSVLLSDRLPVALAGAHNGTGGGAGLTTAANYTAELNDDDPVSTVQSFALNMFDDSGATHSVTLTLTKTVDNPGEADQWDYALTGFTGGNWNGVIGGTGTESGTLVFDANGNLTAPPTPFTLTVDDTAAASDQTISFDFGGIFNRANTPVLGAVSDVTTSNPPDPTTSTSVSGVLNMDALVGTSFNFAQTWYDRRTGNVAHPMNINFTKIGIHSWSYSISNPAAGGAWTGGASGPLNGTLDFNDNGSLTQINGASPAVFNLGIFDDILADDQTVAVDFTNISEGMGVTTLSTLRSQTRLVSGAGPTTINLDNIVDRTGTHSVPGASVTFTQVGDTNTWDYQVNAPTTSGFTGVVTGGKGSVAFTEDGDLIGPSFFTATLDDGTSEGQSIVFNMIPLAPGAVPLKMGRSADFGGTTSDGSRGTGDISINAEIFYSGADETADPVMTLFGVSTGARTANLGGISFTVAQATSLDVGLTAFVKAHTYVSATTKDNALQFQVGPDEGMIHRMGIQKMDVQTIFRGGVSEYNYDDIKLDTTLEAQDLIGQIDDAINFVSEENLKVGQFQNMMTRTLDLSRQQQTSITNALSNLNDADMADEATDQSKRSILVQSGTAMVAQSNTTSQFILQLLR